ncbi:hypothetical protein P167DRAFT_3738 [Morchella conica CCBAS932]|uniref:Uncharacterized protein n=1 Tax=Morchella conica CCBAS932 TaxID=1392247 RepID=A0A3N4L439_9PEZI|nr:hypothetical protein P167DRAFT_3738 [Morchella conica CCBAS932]
MYPPGLGWVLTGRGRRAPAVVTWDRTRKSANRPSHGLYSGLYEKMNDRWLSCVLFFILLLLFVVFFYSLF